VKPPAAVEARDLRELGWWTIEHTISGDVEPRSGTVICTIMRVLAALGPEPFAEEESLREIELRGLLMNGIPPRTADEWELAARIFDDDAASEFRRWPVTGGEPEDAGERAAT
jgi:hypothetical protein